MDDTTALVLIILIFTIAAVVICVSDDWKNK